VKIIRILLSAVFLTAAICSSASYAVELDDFSENKKIYIHDVMVVGNKLLSEKEIFDISGLDRRTGFYISDISKGIQNLIRCGFFSEVSYTLNPVESGFSFELRVKENPPLASLKIVESKMLDLTVFKEKLLDNSVTTDMVFSPAMLEKSIEEFNIYNQNFGIFMYLITYRVVTSEEIIKEGGRFLYEPNELEKNGVHVLVYIREIPRMVIGEIKMTDISISYDQVLNFLMLKQGMPISSDKELFFRYKRLKKLGFYENIYFKLVQQDDTVYKLVIQGKEISLSEISTTLTAPSNIGLITSAEYYNVAVMKTLQRFRMSAGWELMVGAPIFVLEYTHPYFWYGLFVDTTFSKTDQVDTIKDQSYQKLTNNYDAKLTVGYNIWENLFAYSFHNERYAIANTVDSNYDLLKGDNPVTNTPYEKSKKLYHSSGIMLLYDSLDDNFFITQGYKLMGEYETYWKSPLAYKAQASAELYIPVPFFNLIVAVNNRTNFLFTSPKDLVTTLTLDSRMRTNVQEIQTVSNQQIKLTTYSSAEMRFPMPDWGDLKNLSFVVFTEGGGAWADYQLVSLAETRFGGGIGFRLSPRKHYSSFLFQFPAGLYLGYRIGDSKVKPTLISHRDQMYYINLTASF